MSFHPEQNNSNLAAKAGGAFPALDLASVESDREALLLLQGSFVSFARDLDGRMSSMESAIARLVDMALPTTQHGALVKTSTKAGVSQASLPNDVPATRGSGPGLGSLTDADRLTTDGPPTTCLTTTTSGTTSNPARSLAHAPCPSPAVARPVNQAGPVALQVVGVERKAFTKKPFPDFEVRAVDAKAGGLFADTRGCAVELRLISGHELYCDSFLAGSGPLVFPLCDGKARISGLKFLAVSSRNGGHFKIEFTVRAQDTAHPLHGTSARSDDVKVLSERLKNEQKADSIMDLCSDDSLSRVPGLGKQYATKFADQGIHTIRDLAAFHPSGRKRRLALLKAVRRDRGALTEVKLTELIASCRAVSVRDDGAAPAARPLTPPTSLLPPSVVSGVPVGDSGSNSAALAKPLLPGPAEPLLPPAPDCGEWFDVSKLDASDLKDDETMDDLLLAEAGCVDRMIDFSNVIDSASPFFGAFADPSSPF